MSTQLFAISIVGKVCCPPNMSVTTTPWSVVVKVGPLAMGGGVGAAFMGLGVNGVGCVWGVPMPACWHISANEICCPSRVVNIVGVLSGVGSTGVKSEMSIMVVVVLEVFVIV